MVSALDGHHFEYFDSVSQTLVPRSAWMERNASEYHWELFNEPLTNQYHGFKALLANLQQQFNQSQPDAVHTFQNLYGCDWDSASGHEDAYHHHGYDGKDFIWFNMKTGPIPKWEAVMPEAEPLARKWNSLTRELKYLRWYFSKECPEMLRKYVSYARETLERIGTTGAHTHTHTHTHSYSIHKTHSNPPSPPPSSSTSLHLAVPVCPLLPSELPGHWLLPP